MKEMQMLHALNEVKEEYIEEVSPIDIQKKRKRKWVKWVGLAATLVLGVYLGQHFFVEEGTENYFSANVVGGMVSLESEEALLTKNPWLNGMHETKYPVYKNLAYTSVAGVPVYFSEEELLSMAEDVAEKLDTTLTEWEYFAVVYDGLETKRDVYQITAQSALAEIKILGNGEVSISFHEEVVLPEEHQFSHDNSYKEATLLIQYLTEAYGELLGLENPADDCGINYDLTGKRYLTYKAYEVGQEGTEAVTEYCFKNVSFYGDEEGLSNIHFGDVRVAAEYLGDYEIISLEEARKRLEKGNYVSVSSEEDALGGIFSDENIRLVELTYLTGSTCQYYQPYYCFYVEVESFTEGISNYTTFYVPALTEEHLSQFSEENPIGN